MRTVTVVYHLEDGSWWAEADDVPGFVAGADTFDETRARVHEGLEFDLGEPVEVDERFDDEATVARRQMTFTHDLGALVLPATTSRLASPPHPRTAVHRPPAEVERPAAVASS